MKIKLNTDVLSAHLKGHSVPKVYVQRVREALDLFQGVPTVEVYNALPHLRKLLYYYSCDPQLSVKQKLVIRKAYLTLIGDSSVIDMQLDKDIQAIRSAEPVSAMDAWPFILKGIQGHGHKSVFVGKPTEVFTRHYRLVNQRKKVDMNAISLTTVQVIKDLDRWASLPVGLRRFSDWSYVFPGVDLGSLEPKPVSNVVGSVGFTQEPGMKLRLFASPYQFIQCFLKPVKDGLQRLLATLPEDCHMNQEKGREAVQQQLRDGKVVSCFDLSSATHLFPWSLQRKVLCKLGIPNQQLSLLDYAVKGEYTSTKGVFQWSNGQPLGLYPSFFAFSLTHHYLVRGIFHRLNKDPDGGYVLLGDDIAIFDEDVSRIYVKMMSRIGCKINQGKSIISSEVGEFAGAYIDRRNIINIGKLRAISDKNVLSVNRHFSTVDDRYEGAVNYLNGELDPVVTSFVSLIIKSKITQKFQTIQGLTPGWVRNHVRLALKRKRIPLVAGPYPVTSDENRLTQLNEWFDSVYSKCPQCWPDSIVPTKVGITKALMGATELLNSAIPYGGSTPIWWDSFCNLLGVDSDLYTHFRAVRLVLRELASLMILPNGLRYTEGKYFQIIKHALRKAGKMQPMELILAVNQMAVKLSSIQDIIVLGTDYANNSVLRLGEVA